MRRGLALVVPPVLFALLLAARHHFLPMPRPAHIDEPAWMASSYYFDLFIRGDVFHDDWSLLPARDAPPVGKYLFGAALALSGRPVQSLEPLAAWYAIYREVPGAWGEGEARARRQAVVDRLSDATRARFARGRYHPFDVADYETCRVVVAVFGVISVFLVSWLGALMRGPLTGLLAGLVMALHPLATASSRVALFDMVAVAFTLGAVACLAPLMRESQSALLRVALGLAAGLLASLAVGTKMNALVVAVVALGALAWLLAKSRREAFWLALGLVAGTLVFFGINPALYRDAVGGLGDLVALPAETTRIQAEFLEEYLPSMDQRVRALGTLLLGHPWGPLVIGLVALAPTVQGVRRVSPRSVVALWFWVAFVLVVLWLPFPWPRYALPLLAPGALLVADACVGLISRVKGSIQGERAAANTLDARAR